MTIFNLILFISSFFVSGCAIQKKELQPAKFNDQTANVDLTSSQLSDFKVSYSNNEVADSGNKVVQNAAESVQVLDSQKAADNLTLSSTSTSPQEPSVDETLPFKANTGECYAKVEIPASFKDEQLSYVKKEASYSLEVIEPEYSWEDKKIQLNEAEEHIEVIPAVYEWINDEVIFNMDHGQVSKVVRKKIMVTPPKVVRRQIPAKYQTVKIKKLVKPAQTKRVEIPAVYGTVMLPVETQKAHYDWRKVLCATQITTDLVYKLQNALQKSNHYSGVIDGIFGSQTLEAVQNYQKDNKIAVGQITSETLKKLGIEK